MWWTNEIHCRCLNEKCPLPHTFFCSCKNRHNHNPFSFIFGGLFKILDKSSYPPPHPPHFSPVSFWRNCRLLKFMHFIFSFVSLKTRSIDNYFENGIMFFHWTWCLFVSFVWLFFPCNRTSDGFEFCTTVKVYHCAGIISWKTWSLIAVNNRIFMYR